MEINTVNTVMPQAREMPNAGQGQVSGGGKASVAHASSVPSSQAPSIQSIEGGAGVDAGDAAQKSSAARQAALKAAMDAATQTLKQTSPALEFQVDPETKQTVVRVVDTTNNQVIKQIPSAEFLRISSAIEGLQKNLLDDKA